MISPNSMGNSAVECGDKSSRAYLGVKPEPLKISRARRTLYTLDKPSSRYYDGFEVTSVTAARGQLGRQVLKGLLAVCCCAPLALVPLGGSSKSSELQLQPYLPRSPHQAYGYSLAHGRLSRSPARAWLVASETAIAEPAAAALPFETGGRFDAAGADAVGYRFGARSGRRMLIEVATQDETAGEGAVFVDLFLAADGGPVEYLRSAPPLRTREADSRQRIELAILQDGEYLLRVQPSLDYEGRYEVSIRSAPLLTFPVEGAGTRAIQSGFGAERDGGARAHRGVDIFAPRGTPALAAMDAWVTRVDTTPRGGNVVWLQPMFGNMRLYYAHLDTQLVQSGDFVQAGDAVGTVGNTGNAITTPPHLHFGVYLRQQGMRGGARDPYPFLD
jgi:peptidoglycan LD-endopeptidase LytH